MICRERTIVEPAGIDLVERVARMVAEVAERSSKELTVDEGLRGASSTFRWIPKLECPSVAAVQGHAFGAGFQLAFACDFRVFARSAQVALAETRYGLMPDMGATVYLPIVGEARARELILLGDVIHADEAVRIGLATRLVNDDELWMAAHDLAERLAAQPPVAIRGAPRAIDAAWHWDSDESFRVAVAARSAASDLHAEVVLSIALGRHDRSARFKEVVHPSRRHWMHHLELHGPSEIDDEVVEWLREAMERAS